MAVKRNTVVIGAVVVAVALAVAAFKGFFGYPPNTSGSIGAAKRYHTDQISASDVQLGDARTQAFLQSDLFHRLQTDAEFRKSVIEDGGVGRMFDMQAYATDASRVLTDASKYLEGEKRLEQASKAEELAKQATALASLKDMSKASEADKMVTSLVKTVDGFIKDLDAAKNVTNEKSTTPSKSYESEKNTEVAKGFVDQAKMTELDRVLEGLARFNDESRTYLMNSRVEDALGAVRELESRAESAKNLTVAKAASDAGKSLESASLRLDGAKTMEAEKTQRDGAKAVDAEMIRREGAKAVDAEHGYRDAAMLVAELAKSKDVEKFFDGGRFIMFVRQTDALVRMDVAARGYLTTARAEEVASVARDVEQKADAARLEDLAGRAKTVALMADALGAQKDASKQVTPAKAAQLDQAMRDLAKSQDLLKLDADAAAVVRTLQKTYEEYGHVADAGLFADAAAQFMDLAHQVDSGKYTTTP